MYTSVRYETLTLTPLSIKIWAIIPNDLKYENLLNLLSEKSKHENLKMSFCIFNMYIDYIIIASNKLMNSPLGFPDFWFFI